jgi:hypothetical protein
VIASPTRSPSTPSINEQMFGSLCGTSDVDDRDTLSVRN